jgi:type I restriction enzyme R subunit
LSKAAKWQKKANKAALSERDICTKFIAPAIQKAGWDIQTQILDEVFFKDGRISVRGKIVKRGVGTRSDDILYQIPNLPLAIVKDNKHTVSDGDQCEVLPHPNAT